MKSGLVLLACALIAGGGFAYAQKYDAHDVVKGLIADTASEDETLVGDMLSGELSDEEAAIFSVPIDPAKSYMIYATCDSSCIDLDTVLLDKAGNIIDSDDSDDDVPIISVGPGEAGDQLNLRVEMQTCIEDKCVWALGVYEQL